MKTVKVINKQTGAVSHLTASPRCGSLVDLGNWGGAFLKRGNNIVTHHPNQEKVFDLSKTKVYHSLLESAPKAGISGIYNSCYCKE